MSDIGAIVLHKILETKSLDAWARIKMAFFDPSYSSIFTAISKHYSTYNSIPGFEDLAVTCSDTPLSRAIAALKTLELPDVDLDLAIDALINTYTQNESLKLIEKFVDGVTLMDTEEIKGALSNIVMKLDEKVHTSETVVTLDEISVFQENGALDHIRFPLGLNNTFDAGYGAYREELILVGGKRGSGKSIVCSNAASNQYEDGNVVPYFTIEMTAKETFDRIMANLSRVNYMHIRQDNLDQEETIKIAKARAGMFEHGEQIYKEFLVHKDRIKFERTLRQSGKLKEDNQIIIIDDRELTLPAIDLHLQKLKYCLDR